MTKPGPASKLSRAEHLNMLGHQFFNQGQLEPARLHFLGALFLEPDNPHALANLGAVLRQLGHYPASEVVTRRAVAITKGENPYFISNLGVSLLGLKKYDQAIEMLKKSLDQMPKAAAAWHNYGLALYMAGRYGQALMAFDQAVSLQPNPQLLSDRALTLLSLERIQDGLEAYEDRWNVLQQSRIWKLNIPEWKGESLENRRILLHHEQGFGDSIMLVRFVKQVLAKKAHVTLAVPKELVRLFAKSFPAVTVFDFMDEGALNENSHFDFHSPLLSTMRWVGIQKAREISFEPYLHAKPEPVMRLPNTRIKIGICWASGDHSEKLRERRRLVPLSLFMPLLENRDISLISLQKGAEAKEIVENGLEGLVFDIQHKLEDFHDTAETIASLNLVISVDSAVAHVAGGLGKPCLMLSPYTRCWRWWGEKTGWPWYNRMKIFSQSEDGSWEEPMRRVVKTALWVVNDTHTGLRDATAYA